VGSLERRLEVLEDRIPAPEGERQDRSEARERIRENLDRIAYLRRSDGPEAVAELEAFRVAVERQIAKRRGEGVR
jgi:hypothetical protein